LIYDQVKKDAESRCQQCGIFVAEGHVHHVKPDGVTAENVNDLENLRYLCPTCHRLVHLGKDKPFDKVLNFRVEPVDRERWQIAADEAGVNLSEWIRRRLNRHAGSDHQDAARVPDVPVAGVRAAAPRRPSTRPVPRVEAKSQGAYYADDPLPDFIADVEPTPSASLPTVARESKFSELELEVARRTGHPPGCGCQFVCGASLRFLMGTAPKQEEKPVKKGRRR
jgi:hypothetical protein